MKLLYRIILNSSFFSIILLSAGCGSSSYNPDSSTITSKNLSTGSHPGTANLPTTPTGVTATSGIYKITLSWDAVPGADSYNIYWSIDPGVTTATGTKITGVTNPYQHVGLYVSRVYFYIVTAVSSTGESLASDQASTVAATDSANLYTAYCEACHGLVISSTIMGGTSENIKTAISKNTGGMGWLSTLTSSQIDIISQQLPCH